MSPQAHFDNSYARLPKRFYSEIGPHPVSSPTLVRVNHELAKELGFDPDWLQSPEGVAALAGNAKLEGSKPLAAVYAGHQFGNWNPQLGDGRAVLLGEVLATSGKRFDIQLKGSGQTPYSRRGDGRSPLGPVVREYIISEAMYALGIPTTRSLAAICTGEQVIRQSPLVGGVLTRVASSHIRVGTFEWFASQGDSDATELLIGHVLARHFPEVNDPEVPALALLKAVTERQAKLIAQWQLVGFIHGVMNTDNVLVSGETIDYGPCAFMDEYDPNKVFSSIDRQGRYAYGNQPGIGQWNMARLAQAFLPLLGRSDETLNELQAIVGGFEAHFSTAFQAGMAHKMGLESLRDDQDFDLVDDFLELMHQTESDFTTSFRALGAYAEGNGEGLDGQFETWLSRWNDRLDDEAFDRDTIREKMDRVNPLVIPRNHRVEEAIEAAYAEDYQPFHSLIDVLRSPFAATELHEEYAVPPGPSERVCATFCGT